MRKAFVRTENVQRFVGAMSRLQNRPPELPGMALVFGDPGLGKSRTALWWGAANDGIFVRVKSIMSANWLLSELVGELGESPMKRSADLFRQAAGQLLEKPRTVFIDECDYLAGESKTIEILRDLHDVSGAPFVLLGMSAADKKLMRYKHLFDRFSEIVKFTELSQNDVKTIAHDLCEAPLSADAVQYIHSQANRFRKVVVQLYRCEAIAKANSLKEVNASHLQGVKK